MTGKVEKFIVPENGLYKLEAWGAQGSNTYGGKGGYSVGYADLTMGEVIYICVGGQGAEDANGSGVRTGGYNGGGDGRPYYYNDGTKFNDAGNAGGGATHMAKVSGKLAVIGFETFVTKRYGLIVAGGGGGSVWTDKVGGTGGGTSGGDGTVSGKCTRATGGTQTSGGRGADNNSETTSAVAVGQNGSFGKGGNGMQQSGSIYPDNCPGYGGGGGLFGGGAGLGLLGDCSGGGGSGFIGNVPKITVNGKTYTPSMENGVQSGNGKARITFVESLA